MIFCGHRIPHPLVHNFELRITTVPDTRQDIVLKDAIGDLSLYVETMIEKVQKAFDSRENEDPNMMDSENIMSKTENNAAASSGWL